VAGGHSQRCQRGGQGGGEGSGVVGPEPFRPAHVERGAGDDLEGGPAGAGHHGGAGHGVAAVIVEYVEDLHHGPIGQWPPPVVERPALVGPRRGEAAPRVVGGFRGIGDDQATSGEDPPDRRLVGQAGQVPEMKRDRGRTSVQAGTVELLAFGDDRFFDIGRGTPRRMVRGP
jgi:hypothetical protein